MPRTRLKKTALLLVKLSVSLGLLSFLVAQAQRDASFTVLRDQPKHWGLLAAAWLALMTAVLITFFRWMLLVRTLGIPFQVHDALRLGFLGYLFNFVSLGSVGGDLFKAVFIAREQPGRRTEAVATVVVDRLIGLYALLLVASSAVLWANWQGYILLPQVRSISRATLICAGAGFLAISTAILPGFSTGPIARRMEKLPLVGHTIEKLFAALRVYRANLPVLFVSTTMSVGVHLLATLSIYLIARGLPGAVPSLREHLLIGPLSIVAGALPLPMAGLGAFEGALEFLYRYTAMEIEVSRGRGLVVALCYRLMTVLIAAVGACYYITRRKDVDEALRDAEDESELEAPNVTAGS